MKDNPITVGFDDAKFELHSTTRTTQLIGVICQGTRLVKVIRSEIEIDGDDASEKLIELVKQNEKHVQYLLLHSITFGGFNIVDLEKIYDETKKPIIAVTEREVDLDGVKKALYNKFPKSVYYRKLQFIIRAGNLYKTEIKTAGGFSKVYFHVIGIEVNEAQSLLQKTCIDSKLPECIRMAHLIGRIF